MIKHRRHPGRTDLAVFAIAMPTAFAVFGLWGWHLGGSWHFGIAFWIAAGALGLLNILSPNARLALYLGSIKVITPVGLAISYLLLAVVYFGIVTPMGLVLRVVRGDFLGRRKNRDAQTFWEDRPTDNDLERYFHQS